MDEETGEVSPAVCACPSGNTCKSAGKHPLNSHGSREPLRTGLDVDLWWADNPVINVGIATGEASGLVVLDIDPAKGGWDSYSRIVKKQGAFPPTPVGVTGSGGRHVLFQHPTGTTIKNSIGYMPGIDVRADGGLIVAPPSLHGCGGQYHWHKLGHPSRVALAPLPAWLLTMQDLEREKRRRRNSSHMRNTSKYGQRLDPSLITTMAEGERNKSLCSIVGRLCWESKELGNLDPSEIMAITEEINKTRCIPPLPEGEVRRLVESAIRRWA